MFAVIETGGKQYKVEVGQTIQIEKLAAEVGTEVSIGRVLLAQTDSGTKVGTPMVAGASVTVKVKAHGRGQKVLAQKHRRRKQYRRLHGHRQSYTQVEVLNIQA